VEVTPPGWSTRISAARGGLPSPASYCRTSLPAGKPAQVASFHRLSVFDVGIHLPIVCVRWQSKVIDFADSSHGIYVLVETIACSQTWLPRCLLLPLLSLLPSVILNYFIVSRGLYLDFFAAHLFDFLAGGGSRLATSKPRKLQSPHRSFSSDLNPFNAHKSARKFATYQLLHFTVH